MIVTWELYDMRAAGGFGTVDAALLEVCESEQKAIESAADYGEASCYTSNGIWQWDYRHGSVTPLRGGQTNRMTDRFDANGRLHRPDGTFASRAEMQVAEVNR